MFRLPENSFSTTIFHSCPQVKLPQVHIITILANLVSPLAEKGEETMWTGNYLSNEETISEMVAYLISTAKFDNTLKAAIYLFAVK